MFKVINNKNNPCMAILDNMQLNTLDQAIKTVDPNVSPRNPPAHRVSPCAPILGTR